MRSDDSRRRGTKSADSPPSQCSLGCQTERESTANGEGQMIARVKNERKVESTGKGNLLHWKKERDWKLRRGERRGR